MRTALLRSPWTSATLGIATAALFLVTLQAGLFNDGIYFEEKLRTGNLGHVHLLNLPLMAWLQWMVSWVYAIDAETAIKATAAVAGGITIALTHRVGLRLLAPGSAVCAALLLAVLPGFWFHATASEIHTVHSACALLLLLGLLRALDPGPQPGNSAATCLLIFLGALLGPASHASGAAAGLAGAFVVLRAPRRLPIAVAGLLGFAGYLGLQKTVATIYPDVEFGNAVASMLFPLRNPGRIPGLLGSAASELVLYAIPAATLCLAGILRIGRDQRDQAWTLGCWMAGYVLVTLPVYDRAMGSYFIPVYPVHAVAALAAATTLGRSPARWLLVLGLACLPLALVSFGDVATLPAFAVCSVVLARLSRTGVNEGPAPVWLLPSAAAVLTAIVYLPGFGEDPIRQRIRAVAAYAGDNPVLLAFIPDPVASYHWAWQYPGSGHNADFVINPYLLDVVRATEEEKGRPPAEVAAIVQQLRTQIEQRIRTALDRGQTVLLVDAPDLPPVAGPGAEFRSHVETLFRVERPEEAPPDVYRVRVR